METEIENAIEIAGNPSSSAEVKQQVFQFLNQLGSTPQGWQACTTLFVRTPRTKEVVRLVCLETINFTIHTHGLDSSSLIYLKDTLLEYVRTTYGRSPTDFADPAHLQNKLCQTLTYLFVFLYKSGWESFVDDFLAITGLPNGTEGNNIQGVILYLRLLGSVHDEIADMLLTRQSSDTKRNTELKDQIRAQDMQKIAQSWKDILVRYGNDDDTVVEMILKVIAKWVSWMDISLVVGQDMMSLLLPLVGRTNATGSEDKVRDAAIDTLTEIVGKKMKSADKMELITFLDLPGKVAQLVASAPLTELRSTPRYDTDLAEAVAKLVNTVMSEVVKALEDPQIGDDARAKADGHLQAFLPFLLRFFSDDYDEVCSTVIPSLTDLLTALRKLPALPPSYTEMLPPILNAIIMKMRYDETSTWGDEENQTDEAEFEELRKRLHNLQKLVAAIDQALYMDILSSVVANLFQTLDQQGSQMDWRDLDLALHEMYLFGELALTNQGTAPKSQPSSAAAERLVIMIQKMIESGIANFDHPAILIQYMDICVRYCEVFETHHEYIPRLLESFIRLIHLDHVRIKKKSYYLFFRLVKHLRAQVGNVAETVIQSIADLLPIHAEAPEKENGADIASDDTNPSDNSLFWSQKHLFEAISYMCSTNGTPPEKQALYIRSVMEPIFADMEIHLPQAKAGDAQATRQIEYSVWALGMLAPGFSDAFSSSAAQRPVIPKVVTDEFVRAAEAILVALGELKFVHDIRAACRSAFNRLVNIIQAAVLPQLPQWIDGLLAWSSSKDEMAFFLRLLDQIVYGFKAEIYDILNLLLTPLLQRICNGLSEPVNGTDDEIQLGELRREYLTFILVILNNNLAGVLISEANQGFFETLVASILTVSRTIERNNSQNKLAFSVMTRMTQVWGGPDLATISLNPTAPTGSPSPVIPGFEQFLIERFHPACWEVMQAPQFRPDTDAQMKQLLNEIAALQQAIYVKTGEMYLQHVQAVTFPTLGINGPEFLQALTTSTDKKMFSAYLLGLIKGRR